VPRRCRVCMASLVVVALLCFHKGMILEHLTLTMVALSPFGLGSNPHESNQGAFILTPCLSLHSHTPPPPHQNRRSPPTT